MWSQRVCEIYLTGGDTDGKFCVIYRHSIFAPVLYVQMNEIYSRW